MYLHEKKYIYQTIYGTINTCSFTACLNGVSFSSIAGSMISPRIGFFSLLEPNPGIVLFKTRDIESVRRTLKLGLQEPDSACASCLTTTCISFDICHGSRFIAPARREGGSNEVKSELFIQSIFIEMFFITSFIL